MNMKLEKLGGILFNMSTNDTINIKKPKMFIFRKLIMSIIKLLSKLIKGD